VIRTALGHQYTDLVEIYDTNARKWRQGPPMMKPSGHSFAIVHEGVIYVVAGWSEDRAWAEESRLLHGFESTLMQAYDLAAKCWSVLPTPMPAPRYEGDGAQLFDGQLCMIGGWSTISSTGEDDKLPRREVFQYDPRRKACVARLTIGGKPARKKSHPWSTLHSRDAQRRTASASQLPGKIFCNFRTFFPLQEQ